MRSPRATGRRTRTMRPAARSRRRAGPSPTPRSISPRRITWGNNQATNFTYDSTGARVLKRDGTLTTITVAGLFERRIASADVNNLHYILADGRAVAQVAKTQAVPERPHHTDYSGDLPAQRWPRQRRSKTTNPNGTVRDEYFYDPFGRRTDRNYDYLAPQQRIMRTRLHGARARRRARPHQHAGGHISDPVARHFISPDPPDSQAPLFSQSYNRYSYVGNNPTTFIDPTGFQKDRPGEEDTPPPCTYGVNCPQMPGDTDWTDFQNGIRDHARGGIVVAGPADGQVPFPGPGGPGCPINGGCTQPENADDNPGTDAGGSSSYGSEDGPGSGPRALAGEMGSSRPVLEEGTVWDVPTDNWVMLNGTGPGGPVADVSDLGLRLTPVTITPEMREADAAIRCNSGLHYPALRQQRPSDPSRLRRKGCAFLSAEEEGHSSSAQVGIG